VNPTAGATGAHEDRMWKRPGASTKARHIPFLAQGGQQGDAVDNFYARRSVRSTCLPGAPNCCSGCHVISSRKPTIWMHRRANLAMRNPTLKLRRGRLSPTTP
jgi:hypothetical protein